MVSLTFYTYPTGFGWLGLLAMGWMRLPLFLNGNITFWKLLGVGQMGFRPQADSTKWAVLIVWRDKPLENTWWQKWMKAKAEVKSFYLQPTFGHGNWAGRDPFAEYICKEPSDKKIAVLTRASIRWKMAKLFWASVPPVAKDLYDSFQPEFTEGVGEIPYIRQATFSVWKSEADMKRFAYQNEEHKKVIEMTKKHQWYSEELFYRFVVLEER
jgi:hypothetical protein